MRIKVTLSCVILAAVLCGTALAAGNAWQKNTWHENTMLSRFHAYFFVGPNHSSRAKGFALGLQYGQDLPLHHCTLRLGSAKARPATGYQEDGYSYTVGFRWPRMAYRARATVACDVQGQVLGASVNFGNHASFKLRKT